MLKKSLLFNNSLHHLSHEEKNIQMFNSIKQDECIFINMFILTLERFIQLSVFSRQINTITCVFGHQNDKEKKEYNTLYFNFLDSNGHLLETHAWEDNIFFYFDSLFRERQSKHINFLYNFTSVISDFDIIKKIKLEKFKHKKYQYMLEKLQIAEIKIADRYAVYTSLLNLVLSSLSHKNNLITDIIDNLKMEKSESRKNHYINYSNVDKHFQISFFSYSQHELFENFSQIREYENAYEAEVFKVYFMNLLELMDKTKAKNIIFFTKQQYSFKIMFGIRYGLVSYISNDIKNYFSPEKNNIRKKYLNNSNSKQLIFETLKTIFSENTHNPYIKNTLEELRLCLIQNEKNIIMTKTKSNFTPPPKRKRL